MAPTSSSSSSSRTARLATSASDIAPNLVAEPRRVGGRDPRHPPGGRLGVRRVADLRRLVVAGAHQPDVGRRGARPGHQREPDDAAARDAGDSLQAAGLSNGGADAGAAATMARRRVLRLRRHLRRHAPRLSRPRVRLVRDSRSVLARARPMRSSAASRRQTPTFMFFPTISTHFPFIPTPPYQPDWARMLTDTPYGGRAIVEAYEQEPDWTSFGPGYVTRDVAIPIATLGRLPARDRRDRDRILIVLGRSSAAGGGQRRGRAVGRAGTRHRAGTDQRRIDRRSSPADGARIPARASSRSGRRSADAHAAADPARRLQHSTEGAPLGATYVGRRFSAAYRPAAARPALIASSAVGPCISSARNPSFTRCATSCVFAVSMSGSFAAFAS